MTDQPGWIKLAQGSDGAVLQAGGAWTIEYAADLERTVDSLPTDSAARALDLAGIEAIDTAGAWLIARAADQDNARVEGASPAALRLIAAVHQADQPVQMRPDATNPFLRVVAEMGESVSKSLREFAGIIGFFGATLVALFSLMRNPGRIRWHAVITRFETVGVNALGIVGLMSFLIGRGHRAAGRGAAGAVRAGKLYDQSRRA
ncbi:MAG: hypothetical protein HC861_01915, partial [Rhodospirillaceae bacterium]|nr:hypothetical protein [Rhodospirillaceae bacterium]